MANPNPVTEHLLPTVWRPGQSGNPAGRPKNTPLVTPALRRLCMLPMTELRDLIHQVESGDVPESMTAAEALALVVIKKALTDVQWGDSTREMLIKRLDGSDPDVGVEVSVGVLVRYVNKA